MAQVLKTHWISNNVMVVFFYDEEKAVYRIEAWEKTNKKENTLLIYANYFQSEALAEEKWNQLILQQQIRSN